MVVRLTNFQQKRWIMCFLSICARLSCVRVQRCGIMKQLGGGRIINIGSISAQRVRPGAGPYCASKFGIWGLTQVTALEGRPHGITASCLHPGGTQVMDIPDGDERADLMQVDDLAQAAVLMATLPPNVNMLEAKVLPVEQPYLGRG